MLKKDAAISDQICSSEQRPARRVCASRLLAAAPAEGFASDVGAGPPVPTKLAASYLARGVSLHTLANVLCVIFATVR